MFCGTLPASVAESSKVVPGQLLSRIIPRQPVWSSFPRASHWSTRGRTLTVHPPNPAMIAHRLGLAPGPIVSYLACAASTDTVDCRTDRSASDPRVPSFHRQSSCARPASIAAARDAMPGIRHRSSDRRAPNCRQSNKPMSCLATSTTTDRRVVYSATRRGPMAIPTWVAPASRWNRQPPGFDSRSLLAHRAGPHARSIRSGG
jgi:hypothetical protein